MLEYQIPTASTPNFGRLEFLNSFSIYIGVIFSWTADFLLSQPTIGRDFLWWLKASDWEFCDMKDFILFFIFVWKNFSDVWIAELIKCSNLIFHCYLFLFSLTNVTNLIQSYENVGDFFEWNAFHFKVIFSGHRSHQHQRYQISYVKLLTIQKFTVSTVVVELGTWNILFGFTWINFMSKYPPVFKIAHRINCVCQNSWENICLKKSTGRMMNYSQVNLLQKKFM